CDVVKNDPEYYQNCISDMAEALNDQELCQSVLRCDGCESPKPPACAKHLEEQDWKKFDYTPLEKDVENNPAVASYCREYKVKDNQEKCFWGLSRKYFSGKADEVLSKKFKACLGKPSEELFELCARHGAETFLLENNQL